MSLLEKQELLKRINNALVNIRPHLKVDGGDVEVVDVTDDMKVQIKWIGACSTCSMSAMTMKAGIEQSIKMQVPEITGVEALNGLNFVG